MSATNLADLFIIAPAVELALQQLFDDDVACRIQRETEDLPGERVDAQFTLGAWTGHWHRTPMGKLVHAAWAYTLRLNLCTNRQAEHLGRHAELVGAVRAKLFDAMSDADFLPYHSLASLNEQSVSEQIAVEDEQDVSTMQFTGIVVVKPDAWPDAV